jgi:uncharacterized membrane protein YraQ (UPF0718 family)
MALLMGWQFTLAEFVGGPLMIVLVAVPFRLLLRDRLLREARAQADRGITGSMERHAAMDMAIQRPGSFASRLLSRDGYTAVTHVFVMEWAVIDLIILPILNIYRKYYGARMALFLLGTFYAAMAGAGYVVEVVFGGLGLIRSPAHARIPDQGVSWRTDRAIRPHWRGRYAADDGRLARPPRAPRHGCARV